MRVHITLCLWNLSYAIYRRPLFHALRRLLRELRSLSVRKTVVSFFLAPVHSHTIYYNFHTKYRKSTKINIFLSNLYRKHSKLSLKIHISFIISCISSVSRELVLALEKQITRRFSAQWTFRRATDSQRRFSAPIKATNTRSMETVA